MRSRFLVQFSGGNRRFSDYRMAAALVARMGGRILFRAGARHAADYIDHNAVGWVVAS